jgi:hypothetical protein
MKEQHKLKMVSDYEGGKVPAQTAAKQLGISKRQFQGDVASGCFLQYMFLLFTRGLADSLESLQTVQVALDL